MNKISWEYIAGFFDGEGSIFIQRAKTKAHGSFKTTIGQSSINNGEEILGDIREFLNTYGIRCCVSSSQPKRLGASLAWSLVISRIEDIREFLEGMLPYLRVKRLLAQDVIRYLILFPRLSYRTRGKAMNKKRPTGSSCYQSKLIEDDVYVIKRLLLGGAKPRDIAQQFLVTTDTIYSIKYEKSWRHVTI